MQNPATILSRDFLCSYMRKWQMSGNFGQRCLSIIGLIGSSYARFVDCHIEGPMGVRIEANTACRGLEARPTMPD